MTIPSQGSINWNASSGVSRGVGAAGVPLLCDLSTLSSLLGSQTGSAKEDLSSSSMMADFNTMCCPGACRGTSEAGSAFVVMEDTDDWSGGAGIGGVIVGEAAFARGIKDGVLVALIG